MKFPRHACSLSLTHNGPRDYYETVAQAVADGDQYYSDLEDWISEEQREKAIATNEIWTIQWYPSSPVGFYHFHAADLDALMEFVNRKFPN